MKKSRKQAASASAKKPAKKPAARKRPAKPASRPRARAAKPAAGHHATLPIVLAFVRAINARNVNSLADLMTDKHVFIDSLGARFEGRETMLGGWAYYFSLFPDYAIEVTRALVEGDFVMLVGTAHGTLSVGGRLNAENHWQAPAAWTATVADGRISEWRVFCDNDAPRRLIARHHH